MKTRIALFAFVPPLLVFAVTRQEWEATQIDRDAHRLEAAWQRFDFAQTHTTRTVTNTVITQRDPKLADREAKYLAELASAGLSVTNDFDTAADALNAGRGNSATVALGLRLFTLRARIAELGGDPRFATGRTATTNQVTTIEVVPK